MIIGILGYIGSGKGTVADCLVGTHGFTQDSFAASLKDVCAEMFNWSRELLEGDTTHSREWRNEPDLWWSAELGITDFTPRMALQMIGTDTLRNHFHVDIWQLTLKNRLVKYGDKDVVISDVRFPNEINLIREMGGILVEVKRGDLPVWDKVAWHAARGDEDALRDMHETFPEAHYSEWAWLGTKVDKVIVNDDTVDALYCKVGQLFNK